MSTSLETQVPLHESADLDLAASLNRRADIEAKQGLVAGLLAEVGCDGLLVLEPENFIWLTSGALGRGILDPAAFPALYFTPEGRWALCANVDSQRLFDEELDGLGFQLKEWPWHWGRAQLLDDLCQGRTVACDRSLGSGKVVGEVLQKQRRLLSDYAQACLRALGQILSHALEATGRNLRPLDTEREVAGQLSHRLLHRGVLPLVISVAADGRSRLYRQCSFTATPVRSYCVLTAAVRKYGLTAMASRSVSLGTPEAAFRKEQDAACRVGATYVAGTWPDAIPRQVLATGRRVYQLASAEHEWLLAPQGHITGYAPVEQTLTPSLEELFQAGWAVTWNASVGSACSCDTFLISDEGPQAITPTENWPLKKIRVQGAEFIRPDLLIR